MAISVRDLEIDLFSNYY